MVRLLAMLKLLVYDVRGDAMVGNLEVLAPEPKNF